MTENESEILKNLGKKLRELRQSKNISQEKFAEITEIDRTYISGLERGKRNPSYLILKRICDALETNLNNLF